MNVTLNKNENKIEETFFSVNLILFWLKANYVLTDKRVLGNTPNTLVGIIPLGKAEISQPLKMVASVACSTRFFFKRLLIGIILIIVGLSLIKSFGFLFLIFGAVSVLNCYTATFLITNNGGQTVGYEISILEKSKVVKFVNEVNSVITDL